MRRSMAVALAALVVLVGCGGDEPADEEVAAARGSVATADAEDDGDGDEPPAADEAGTEEPDAPGVDGADEDVDLRPPGEVTGAIGVVYEATGAFDETFRLVRGGDGVSSFSGSFGTMYVDGEELTVCPTGESCLRAPRPLLGSMGLLGADVIEDATMWAAEVPWTAATAATIAGRDARCLATTEVEDLEEYCYDVASGLALRWRVVDEGVPTLVEAVEVFDPTDADLRPAGPVQDLGDLGDLGDLDLGELLDLEG
jgi:hypothetical protein